MSDAAHLTLGDADLVADAFDEVVGLYCEIRAEPRYDRGASGALWRREAFVERTRAQLARDGFAAVLARTGEDELVGFSFGVPLGPGRWWTGAATGPPEEILSASKFALIELDVLASWRGMGVGRRMHEMLLASRPERYAILTTLPDAPARGLYRQWGWAQVGTAQHTPDAPVMDALVIPLG